MTCDKGCMPDWWVHSMHLSHLRRKNTTKCHSLKTGIQQRNSWDSSETETFWRFSLLKFPLLLSLMPLKCICLYEICFNASVGAIQSPQRLRCFFFFNRLAGSFSASTWVLRTSLFELVPFSLYNFFFPLSITSGRPFGC